MKWLFYSNKKNKLHVSFSHQKIIKKIARSLKNGFPRLLKTFSHFKLLHCKILTLKKILFFMHCRIFTLQKTHTLKYLHHKILTLQKSLHCKKITLQNTYTTKTFAPHKIIYTTIYLHCRRKNFKILTPQKFTLQNSYTAKKLHCKILTLQKHLHRIKIYTAIYPHYRIFALLKITL